MTSKNSGVSASTTMSSLGKACLELSKSIKGFRFGRQSPQDGKEAMSSSAGAAAPVTRPVTTEDGSVCDDVTDAGSSSGGVASTISRVIRSATNRVRAFPSSPSASPQHNQHQYPAQQQACNAVNGHTPPTHGLPPPAILSTSPHASSATCGGGGRPRCILPAAGNTDVWRDEQFLLRFFRYFSAMELCVLAQVSHPPPSFPSTCHVSFTRCLTSLVPFVHGITQQQCQYQSNIYI